MKKIKSLESFILGRGHTSLLYLQRNRTPSQFRNPKRPSLLLPNAWRAADMICTIPFPARCGREPATPFPCLARGVCITLGSVVSVFCPCDKRVTGENRDKIEGREGGRKDADGPNLASHWSLWSYRYSVLCTRLRILVRRNMTAISRVTP